MSLKNKDRVSKGYIVDEMHSYNILLETREIFLHGFIDNTDVDPGVEYKMSNNFLKNIKLLESLDACKPIVVHQHSIGGEWAEGMMMFDAIQTCTCPVIVVAHGIAASMGSIVPQAADLRVSMPSCWWLIHDGSTDIDNSMTIKQAKVWAQWEEKTREQMLDIYTGWCSQAGVFSGKTEKQVSNFISKQLNDKEDWWLDAADAVKYGFCDAVYGTVGYETINAITNNVC